MPEIKTDEAEKNGAAASAEAPGTQDVKKNKKQKEEAEIVLSLIHISEPTRP